MDTLEPVEDFNEEVRQKIISLWCDASVHRIDTLQEVDQWIPFGRLSEEMPIYKYYFDDPEQHQLYMTSRDGRVLQFTVKTAGSGHGWEQSRIGYISPHYVSIRRLG